MKKKYFVYIMSSQKNGTLYIGITNNIARRTSEHKHRIHEGFTKKYKVYMLVYFEVFDSIGAAIQREKQLKKWKRLWKIQLIEKMNPFWHDLSDEMDGYY